MKKLFFSFVMLVTLVIVAGSVKGQTSATPYKGAKYTYTVSGIDQVAADRIIEVFLTTDDQTDPEASLITPTNNFTVTLYSGGGLIDLNNSGSKFTATLDAVGTTPQTPSSFTFEVTWGTGLTADVTYNLWVKIYDSTSGTCYNMKHLNIVPKVDNLDFAITGTATMCPTYVIPSAQGDDGIADNTILTFTITRIGGVDAYAWSFDFDGQTYTVADGTNSKSVTKTITNTPGAAITYQAEITNTKQYAGNATTYPVNSTSNVVSTNDKFSTTISRVPSIGTFSGN